jgi:hypothetical protein
VGSFCQENNTTKGDGGRGAHLFFLLKTSFFFARLAAKHQTL